MVPFMHVSYTLVFHQSECMCAIKHILFYYRHAHILQFIHVLYVFSLLLRCIYLKSNAWRVGVIYTMQYNWIQYKYSSQILFLEVEININHTLLYPYRWLHSKLWQMYNLITYNGLLLQAEVMNLAISILNIQDSRIIL